MLEPGWVALNFVACMVIWWVACFFFFAGNAPKTLRDLVLQFGLAGTMGFSFAAAFAPAYHDLFATWWTLGLRCCVAIVAIAAYDWRFSMSRQWRMLKRWPGGLLEQATWTFHRGVSLWRRWRTYR